MKHISNPSFVCNSLLDVLLEIPPMIIFQSDEMQIIAGHNIKTGELEVQWNFYTDYMILTPENFGSLIAEIFSKGTGIPPQILVSIIESWEKKQ